MKLVSTPNSQFIFRTFSVLVISLLCAVSASAQICGSPSAVIYGLTNTGGIYPITVATGSVGAAVKSTSYTGNAASSSNGLGYNSTNGKFYYFKRDVASSPQEFVSYDPATNTVAILANSTCATTVHTGCVTPDGKGYYTFDTNGNLNYYNILTNTWTFISSNFVDQSGNNVTTVIQNENAGDIAFDGNGNLWIVTSSSSNYGLYRLPKPVPTAAKPGSILLTRFIDPATPTPSGNSIAGIAFNMTGQFYLGTINDNKLYRLENNLTTTFMGNLSVAGVGNDLTSCAFPLSVLPVKWVSFDAALVSSTQVDLSWTAEEEYQPEYTIEYSRDGSNWSPLTRILSPNVTQATKTYTYTHHMPAAGSNYYRIKMKDQLGNESYSSVKQVTVKTATATITLWPNPASDFIRLSTNSGNPDVPVDVKIFNLEGKMLLQQQLYPGENMIRIAGLQSGTYFLSTSDVSGKKQTQKFVKL